MKIKILVIGAIFIMVSGTVVVSDDVKFVDDKGYFVVDNNYVETKEVKIAVLCEEPIGWGSAKFVFIYLLDHYQWVVGNTMYVFDVTEVYDDDIINGKLTTSNFDVLVCPGGGVGDAEIMTKGYRNLPRVKKWHENMLNFIESGGGYAGYCGGATLMAKLADQPGPFLSIILKDGRVGASCFEEYHNYGLNPIFSPLARWYPERVGNLAYLWLHNEKVQDYNEVEDMLELRSGAPLDVNISKDHPIFDDFCEDTLRVTWVGGPAFIPPDNSDINYHILATYPEQDISDNESTCLYAWRYTGGVRGLIRGYLRSRFLNTKAQDFNENAYFQAGDWEYTNKKIVTNMANKACITAEEYPNANKARIVLSGPHPEYAVWWGGKIEPMDDTSYNNLAEGLYRWVNVTPIDETPEDELRHAWWTIRRQVAWASKKVPDNDLPPVYGPSQVCDFEQESLTLNFSIYGNVETSTGLSTLDLYYRYSDDNTEWTDWTYFATDDKINDGVILEFNSPRGPGYYQFYSIRKVEHDTYTELESVPPGPDASVFIDVLYS
jgi:glutamine amidotransferase-like uncharacterized protein